MNYYFCMDYEFGFECPVHQGREHLCLLAEEISKKMECLQNPKVVKPISLKDHHKVWFAGLDTTHIPGKIIMLLAIAINLALHCSVSRIFSLHPVT